MINRKRGFRIRRKLAKVFHWMTRRQMRSPTRRSLSSPGSKILRLGTYLSRGAQRLCSFRSRGRGYVRVGHEKPVRHDVPKGHLAVYVGQSGDSMCRVMVPVIYFNHPLFGELLREAEKVHGYNHPGGITLPCGISELERIQKRIAESGRYRHLDRHKVDQYRIS
ncbi:auxin-responsive protein SAUR36 [Punica granatum]|uniref:Auxin-responsive protein SAUR36 n=2 Tax=Punica granatum TaxID=22663 RepID=A0A6P8C4W3_PUNGR|nr:auxin-responsive protein SAUR36 [Punica granatum]